MKLSIFALILALTTSSLPQAFASENCLRNEKVAGNTKRKSDTPCTPVQGVCERGYGGQGPIVNAQYQEVYVTTYKNYTIDTCNGNKIIDTFNTKEEARVLVTVNGSAPCTTYILPSEVDRVLKLCEQRRNFSLLD